VEYLLQHLQLVVAHARDVVHLRLERLDRGSLSSAQARCAALRCAGGREVLCSARGGTVPAADGSEAMYVCACAACHRSQRM
jgi:hypothetical protein